MKHLLLGIALILSVSSAADEPKKTKDTKLVCVVSGDEIDKNNLNDQDYSKYKEGKVYFCCGGCKMDFDEDPKKFSTKANFQLVATKQYEQTACPVNSGSIHSEKAKKKLKKVTVNGMEVDLCCPGCLKNTQSLRISFRCYFQIRPTKKVLTLLHSKQKS